MAARFYFQLIFFSKNPCKWCKNAHQVTSKIIGLDLKNSGGKILNVSNLREDIDIIVLRDAIPYVRALGEFHVILENDGTARQLHAFNTSAVDMAASVEFKTSSRIGAEWVIALRKDAPPWDQEWDVVWMLTSVVGPTSGDMINTNSSNTTQVEEKVQETHRIFFIPLELVRALGVVYIEVSLRFSGEGDLGRGLNITYQLNILSSACFFWDQTEGEWKSSGCEVRR